MWYYVVPLESKDADHCIAAMEQVLCKVRAEFEGAQVVHRIHGDREGGLTGERVQRHFAAQGVMVTSTVGFDPNANGRAERGIGTCP